MVSTRKQQLLCQVTILFFTMWHSTFFAKAADREPYPWWSYHSANVQRFNDAEFRSLLSALDTTTDPYLILGVDKKNTSLTQMRVHKILYTNSLHQLRTNPISGWPFSGWNEDRIGSAVEKVKNAFLEILKTDGRKILNVQKDSSGHYKFLDELAEWDLNLAAPTPRTPRGTIEMHHRLLSAGKRMAPELIGSIVNQLLLYFHGNSEAVHNFLLSSRATTMAMAIDRMKNMFGTNNVPKELNELERLNASQGTVNDNAAVLILSLIRMNINVMPLVDRMRFVGRELVRWDVDTTERTYEYSAALLYWEANPLAPVLADACELAVLTGIKENN